MFKIQKKRPYEGQFFLKSYFFASGSKFCKLGPAITPTNPKRTRDPIPNPAAHGLNPPKAKEANKFIIKKHFIFGVSIHNFSDEYSYIETFLCNSINSIHIQSHYPKRFFNFDDNLNT